MSSTTDKEGKNNLDALLANNTILSRLIKPYEGNDMQAGTIAIFTVLIGHSPYANKSSPSGRGAGRRGCSVDLTVLPRSV